MENVDEEFSRERLEKNRDSFTEICISSQEHFEKQLSYISAGALGLSFILIDQVLKDIKSTEWKGLLIAGWCFLGFTLLINLWSHMKAYKSHYKTVSEINRHLKGTPAYSRAKVEERAEFIHKINGLSLITLFLGITSIIIYTSINIHL